MFCVLREPNNVSLDSIFDKQFLDPAPPLVERGSSQPNLLSSQDPVILVEEVEPILGLKDGDASIEVRESEVVESFRDEEELDRMRSRRREDGRVRWREEDKEEDSFEDFDGESIRDDSGGRSSGRGRCERGRRKERVL